MEVREPDARYLQGALQETEVGPTPVDWSLVRLDEITDRERPISYGIVQTGPRVQNGVPCLRVVDIQDGKIQLDDLITTSREVSNAYRRTKLREGDLVVPLRGKVGECAQVDRSLADANLTRGVALVAVLPKYSASYCKQFFSSSRSRTRLSGSMNGSALQEIPIATLRAFKIALPPTLDEQNTIAKTLADADALIDSLEQLLTKKRQIKQGVMQELLTGKRRLPGFVEAWAEVHIGDFTDCTAGGTPSTREERYWGGTLPWMSSGDLHLKRVSHVDGRITEEGLENSSTKWIPAGCVLIGLAGQGKTRGTVAMNLIPLCTNQSIAAIFPTAVYDMDFLYHNLDWRYEELRELSAGDGGRGGLNLTLIRAITVPRPSMQEQQAIAQVLSDMDAELAALEFRLTKAHALKQAMAQALLTGRIRIPLAPQEPTA